VNVVLTAYESRSLDQPSEQPGVSMTEPMITATTGAMGQIATRFFSGMRVRAPLRCSRQNSSRDCAPKIVGRSTRCHGRTS